MVIESYNDAMTLLTDKITFTFIASPPENFFLRNSRCLDSP